VNLIDLGFHLSYNSHYTIVGKKNNGHGDFPNNSRTERARELRFLPLRRQMSTV
jgi:hypothetical protein